MILDGREAFVGGHCVTDEWLGDAEDGQHFSDVSLHLRGPIVHSVQSAFAENWAGETGEVTLERYIAVDDVGKVINPMIVNGQVHGGIAQGIAQALWEYGAYNESGQLVTGSMMDYAVPKADFFPAFEVERTETPTDVNPLGVKGAGETGTIASTPAVANAVMDALAPLGIRHLDMPFTPERVWRAMRQAKG